MAIISDDVDELVGTVGCDGDAPDDGVCVGAGCGAGKVDGEAADGGAADGGDVCVGAAGGAAGCGVYGGGVYGGVVAVGGADADDEGSPVASETLRPLIADTIESTMALFLVVIAGRNAGDDATENAVPLLVLLGLIECLVTRKTRGVFFLAFVGIRWHNAHSEKL